MSDRIGIRTDPETTVTFDLPGLTAIRVDPEHRIIAVDGTSGSAAGSLSPDWRILDLRDGIYGDFHRLLPAGECFSPASCAIEGQHNLTTASAADGPLTEAERWQVTEHRSLLADWDALHAGDGLDGTERTLADALRGVLAILDRLAPGTEG